ncbi:GGDEF domain-containing protein [Salinispira pacifica]
MATATDRNKRTLLRKAGIFSTLAPKELAVIEMYSEFRNLSAGTSIFEPGSTGDELYIVVDGEVVIRRSTEDGDQIDLARYISGDSFGEMDLLYDAPRNAAAVAEKETVLLVFPQRGERFQSILSDHPVIFAQILHKFMAIVAGRIRSTNRLISENTPWIQELRKQVLGDKLTGLYNATYLKEEFSRILSSCRTSTTLMMVKPDNFKHINDTYGHEAGDGALKLIAQTLRSSIRADDIAIRYRGNELAVIMPETDQAAAREIADSICAAMRAIDLSAVVGEPAGTLPLTASVAFGVYPTDGNDNNTLTERVHELLYEARDAGGDRVVCS